MRNFNQVFLIFGALIMTACLNSNGTTSNSDNAIVDTITDSDVVKKIEILTNLTDSEELKASYDNWGVKQSHIIYEQFFISPNAQPVAGTSAFLHWDAELLKSWLDENIPVNFDGYLVVDWESPFEILAKPEDIHHYTAVSNMRSLLERIQILRPYLKTGYYGLPFTSYWPIYDELTKTVTAGKFEADQYKIQAILDMSTALFPSVYQFYNTAAVNPTMDQKVYAELTRVSLKLAAGRPVVLYTWDRYHEGGTAEYRFEKIPTEHYKAHLKNLMRQIFGGEQITGVVIWGADEYYHRRAFSPDGSGGYRNNTASDQQYRKVFNKECLQGETAQECIDRFKRITYENVSNVNNGQ